MLKAFTQQFYDNSTNNEFSFIFCCDLCGKQWKSEPIPFSGLKLKGILKVFLIFINVKATLLWKKEHETAFERANHEGMLYFNRCKKCKKWVCDEHIDLESGICSACCENYVINTINFI